MAMLMGDGYEEEMPSLVSLTKIMQPQGEGTEGLTNKLCIGICRDTFRVIS